MPHLDANALESDPKGMAFLRDVIADRKLAKSWPVRRPRPLAELEAKSLATPLQAAASTGQRVDWCAKLAGK
jgi:hypothetical protein